MAQARRYRRQGPLLWRGGTLLLLFGLTACASYRPLEPAGAELAIAVAPIVNESSLPQLSAPLARAVRGELASLRGVRLTDTDSADLVLELYLSGGDNRPMARDSADTGRPISFLQGIELRVDWRGDWPHADSVMAAEPVSFISESIVYPHPDLVSSRAQTAPRVAADLAAQLRRWVELQLQP